MRKFILLLLLFVVRINSFAKEDFEVNGICYNILSKSEYTCEVTKNSFYYRGNIKIPSKVTYNGHDYTVASIGYMAFYSCQNLKSITIPSTILTINEFAFDGCKNLDGVYIEDLKAWCNIKLQKEFAFGYMTYCNTNPLNYAHKLYLNNELITNLEIPEGVTKISSGAFSGCTEIVSVSIPNSVTLIGTEAFLNCTNIMSVKTKDIGAWASIHFGDNGGNPLTYANYLYENNKLIKKLEIPAGVTEIGSNAFRGCKLESVSLSNTITKIGDGAFKYTEISTIDIPNSVTSIGNCAFQGCSNLGIVNISNSVVSIGDEAFESCRSLKSVIIPNSVTSIGKEVFSNCSNLESISLPKSLVSIGNAPFDACSRLNTFKIEDLSTWILYFQKDMGIFYNTIGWISFSHSYDIILNDNKLVELTIPNSCTIIPKYCFMGCKTIESIVLHENVTAIQESAFGGDKNVNSIICKSVTPPACKSSSLTGISRTDCVIYVPLGSVDDYKNAALWGEFEHIEIDPTTAIQAEKVTLNKNEVTLNIGQTVTLNATISPSNTTYKNVTWSSSDENIATVSESGKVKAVSEGTATITATCGTAKAICTVIVNPIFVDNIILNSSECTLQVGDIFQLEATIKPSNAKNKDISWSSDNEDVAIVSSSGKVLALGVGSATITATAKDGSGITASCKVTVTSVLVQRIELNYTSYSLNKGDIIQLEAIVYPENAENKEIEWRSSNEDVVMVTSSGKVVFVDFGDAVVTAKAKDGSGVTATCVFSNVDGIESISLDDFNDYEIFTIVGQKVQNAKSGLYIIKGKDGKAKKVIVK